MLSQSFLHRIERNRWVERAVLIALLLLFCVALGRYILDSVNALTMSQVMIDFEDYLYAARAITLDENPYTYNQEMGILSYKYPPTLALLLVPLAHLSTLTAQRVWLVVNHLLLGGALLLSLSTVRQRLSLRQLLLMGVATFGFYPIYTNLKLGQVGVVLYFLIALMFWLWQKKEFALAGLCLALAGAIKVIPLGLVAYFLWKKEYRVAVYSVLFFLMIQIVPDVIFGTRWLASYFEAFPTFYQIEKPAYFANQSFYGFFVRLLEAVRYTSSIGTTLLARALALVPAAILFGYSILLSRRDRRGTHKEAAALEVGGVLMAITLLNPISWHHYFVWMLFILPVLIHHLTCQVRQSSALKDLLPAILSLIAFVLLSQPFRLPRLLGYEVSDPGLVATFLKSLIFYGTLLVWGVGISLLHAFRRQEIPSSPLLAGVAATSGPSLDTPHERGA